jgi:hypothetical protein
MNHESAPSKRPLEATLIITGVRHKPVSLKNRVQCSQQLLMFLQLQHSSNGPRLLKVTDFSCYRSEAPVSLRFGRPACKQESAAASHSQAGHPHPGPGSLGAEQTLLRGGARIRALPRW